MCAHGQIFKLSQGFLVNLSTLVYQLKVGELAAALTDLEGAIRLIPEGEKSASAQFSVEVRQFLIGLALTVIASNLTRH
jgi:hypothetical protein